MAKRYLSRFQSADGTSFVYSFPTKQYEYQSTQEVISPVGGAIGADYGVRMLGTSDPVVLENGHERVRALYVGADTAQDTEADNARNKLYRGAFGKLYSVGADGTERWAYAELSEMPGITVSFRDVNIQPMAFGFNRYSPWFGTAQASGQVAITAATVSFNVVNPSSLYSRHITIQIQAGGSGGVRNGSASNTTTGDIYQFTGTAVSANDIRKLDTRVPWAARSTAVSPAYTSDIANYTTPPTTQRYLSFRLAPGTNTIQYVNGGTVHSGTISLVADIPYTP